MNQITSFIPDKYKWLIPVGVFAVPYITRAYHAVTTGGGLAGAWRGIMFGTNVPKPNPPANPPAQPQQ